MKDVDWNKLWKQRDKALKTITTNRFNKSKLRQLSTLMINDAFSRAKAPFGQYDLAKIKIRGVIFNGEVNYIKSFGKDKPYILVHITVDMLHPISPNVLKTRLEIKKHLYEVFNSMDELKNCFVSGVFR